MKKKPPPGATLIARLKEQRLAREQDLVRRQTEGAAAAQPADQPAAANPPKQPEAPAVPHPPASALASVELVAPESVPDLSTPSQSNSKLASHAPASHQQMMVSAAHGNGDLLHRQIDIYDLRPTTDDYFVLTDEIRLAGRFAAVGLIAQGLRLSRLKEQAIYKEHYQTFEDYCRKEHQMSATYAYRLIRMAEMAERIAESNAPAISANTDAMPDPFEVMISLGHRHLMALLPLEPEAAQELLLRGLPATDDSANGGERLPLTRATEKQIKAALRSLLPETVPAKVVTRIVEKKALVSEKQLVPALSKLVEMLEDWAAWLGGQAPPELEAARMGRGQLLTRLAKRFRTASGNIAEALEVENEQ